MGPGMSASCEKNGAVPFGYKEGVMRGIRGEGPGVVVGWLGVGGGLGDGHFFFDF